MTEPEPIPEEYGDLFESRSFAFVSTLLPDGAPHVTPTWVDRENDHVLINTVLDNRKDRNVRRDPRVALAVVDLENHTATSASGAKSSSVGPRGPASTSTASPSDTRARHATPDRAANSESSTSSDPTT